MYFHIGAEMGLDKKKSIISLYKTLKEIRIEQILPYHAKNKLPDLKANLFSVETGGTLNKEQGKDAISYQYKHWTGDTSQHS